MTEEKWTRVQILNKICQLILISDKYDDLRISQFIVNLASKNNINFYTEDSELLGMLNKENLF